MLHFQKLLFQSCAKRGIYKLPPLPNVLTESKVTSYYDDSKYKDLNFEFSETSPEKILNTLKGLNPPKGFSEKTIPLTLVSDI